MAEQFGANWATQLRKGILELSILNALRGGRLYGYQIVVRLRDIEALCIAEGTVYPILSRLRREGFLHTTIEESPEGPPRKYYELTALGRAQLSSMNQHWERLTRGVEQLRKESKR